MTVCFINKAHERAGYFIAIKRLLAVCVMLYGMAGWHAIQAQEVPTADTAMIITGFPTDLDSLKVDSFFREKGIDLALAKRPEIYYEVYRWYRTCYRYGGNSNKGIDCSHFVNMLYEKFYGHRLNSSSSSIYTQCTVKKKNYDTAEEGDLVFFVIKKKRVSHVALYLQNGKFAHATTQAGVIISDKDEPYYKRHFYRVGRVE
jgi:lipoprotein Spr